ncbi:hypothetical protein ABPG75_005827 [Micractinium tetrahymenae]
MVQVMVEVRSGRWHERRQFNLLECTIDTPIAEVKERAEALAAAGEGLQPPFPGPDDPNKPLEAAHEPYVAPPPPPPRDPRPLSDLALTFMGQTCENGKALRDYAVCEEWIRQVAGFVLHHKDMPR